MLGKHRQYWLSIVATTDIIDTIKNRRKQTTNYKIRRMLQIILIESSWKLIFIKKDISKFEHN